MHERSFCRPLACTSFVTRDSICSRTTAIKLGGGNGAPAWIPTTNHLTVALNLGSSGVCVTKKLLGVPSLVSPLSSSATRSLRADCFGCIELLGLKSGEVEMRGHQFPNFRKGMDYSFILEYTTV